MEDGRGWCGTGLAKVAEEVRQQKERADRFRALGVSVCAHSMGAGGYCIHCNRIVPRVGEVTADDRAKAAELANLPQHVREPMIAQALADARVDLRVKQGP
jgi:hypothetical protein